MIKERKIPVADLWVINKKKKLRRRTTKQPITPDHDLAGNNQKKELETLKEGIAREGNRPSVALQDDINKKVARYCSLGDWEFVGKILDALLELRRTELHVSARSTVIGALKEAIEDGRKKSTLLDACMNLWDSRQSKGNNQ